MGSRLTTSLREAPATVPQLAAVVLFVIWSTGQAGYPLTHWAPGALIVLGLVLVAVAAIGSRAGEMAPALRVALACLIGYTALSFLSILWAGVPGDAWEGADRTLLYLLVFALFAGWRQRGAGAALVLIVWILAMTVLAGFVALHISAASGSQLERELPFGRLVYPTEYANANAALWLMACWPALLLARSASLPWWLRGLLAGAAVLLAEVALLGQSRGAFYATPIMLVLVFVLMPGRLRTFALLVPVGGAIAAAAPAVLRVGNHLQGDHVSASNLHTAVAVTFVAAAAAAVVVALVAAIEQLRPLSEPSTRQLRRAVTACAVLALIAVIAGGWAAAGDPVARLRHGWDTFKSVKGYAANGPGSRLTSGLGSNRYDFYRVALDEFLAHPLGGIGADNFQQQYLLHGRSDETPRYPHSIELRTLSETGIAGALLAVIGLAAALLAAGRALRPARRAAARAARDTRALVARHVPDTIAQQVDPLAGTVAAAALGGFAYWVVHGSFDWFWEFAGLGAPAFALLGMACSLAPQAAARGVREQAGHGPLAALWQRRPAAAHPRPTRAEGGEKSSRRLPRVILTVGGVLAVAAAVLSLAAPWLSQLEIESAAHVWTTAPASAYSRLKDASSLDPLSDQADLLAGSIAVRYGELELADRYFGDALARSPNDAYATLERGAIASSQGRQALALALLARAARLNPRDSLTREALAVAQRGRRVSVQTLNRSILYQAQQLG